MPSLDQKRIELPMLAVKSVEPFCLCWSGLTHCDVSDDTQMLRHRHVTLTGLRQGQRQGQEIPEDDRMISDESPNWCASQYQSDLLDDLEAGESRSRRGQQSRKQVTKDLKDFGNEVEVNSLLPP